MFCATAVRQPPHHRHRVGHHHTDHHPSCWPLGRLAGSHSPLGHARAKHKTLVIPYDVCTSSTICICPRWPNVDQTFNRQGRAEECLWCERVMWSGHWSRYSIHACRLMQMYKLHPWGMQWQASNLQWKGMACAPDTSIPQPVHANKLAIKCRGACNECGVARQGHCI
jgi:hypothetical protein